jgi:Domain of unknown function (DUF4386)
VLLVVGFLISGGDTPDYTAADREWTKWADSNELKGRVGALLTLLAGFAFLHLAGTIRSVLGSVEPTRGSVQLARVAFGGAVVGVTGITMAVVIIAGASAEGADADPGVTRAVASTTIGPFLVAAMGFAALLAAAGLTTLRSGLFARWIGVVALLGAPAFLVTFLTLIDGPTKDSVFGYGFFPGFVALAIWSIATSIATYRAVATTAGGSTEAETDS